MTRDADPARLLLRALRRASTDAGCAALFAHESLTPWASATFVGGQHRVLVTGECLDAWLDLLPDADLPVRGHLVASCAVERVAGGAILTVLLLDA